MNHADVESPHFFASVTSDIPCCLCGAPVFEFTIPSDVWNTIVRSQGYDTRGEYLCVGCYHEAVTEWFRKKQWRSGGLVSVERGGRG